MAKGCGCLGGINGAVLMTDADNLRNQIERAKRFARSMTSETDRARFEAMASEFQRELQLVEARRQPDVDGA
jgi:hypothetical protein